MTEQTVRVVGGRLHVVDEGEVGRPPILLLHAGIADLRSWDALVPLLLGAGFRVIRHDTRSYGRSTTDDVEFTERADVIAVMDALGIDRAVLVGNSRGGRIAFDTAVEAPERVVAVVGVATTPGGLETINTPIEIALGAEMAALESADPIDPAAIADIDIRVWVDGPGQSPTRVPAAIREAVREMDTPLNRPDRIEGRPQALEPPVAARPHDLRCPILLVVGALDVSAPAQGAEFLAARAPDVRVETIPDVAHMVGMEVPDTLAAHIVDFLAPIPRWA